MLNRNDGKVRAEVVFDNGEITCYHATWDKGQNRFTACSSARFKNNFTENK